jgi:hypothetical protein
MSGEKSPLSSCFGWATVPNEPMTLSTRSLLGEGGKVGRWEGGKVGRWEGRKVGSWKKSGQPRY